MPRDVEGGRTQSEQRAHQGAGHDHCREERGGQDENDEQARHQRFALNSRTKCLAPAVGVVEERGRDFAVEVHRLLGCPQPLLGIQVRSLPDASRKYCLRVIAGLRHVLTGDGCAVQVALRTGGRALEARNLALSLGAEPDERAIVAAVELVSL